MVILRKCALSVIASAGIFEAPAARKYLLESHFLFLFVAFTGLRRSRCSVQHRYTLRRESSLFKWPHVCLLSVAALVAEC